MQLLAAGSVFAGKYEVVRTISAGGMGVIYEVIHVDTQRRRALKLMLPQILGDDDMRSRFLREGLVTAKVESDHLVEVFDRGIEESSGAPYLVMELLRGEELAARVDRGERTAPNELVTMFEQVCAALDKTHAAGIVHRDLKPENLFVTRRDDGSLRMKILDFGIAKVVDGKTGSTKAVGTPLYMAPEQITGQARATRSETDFYAMAHIAFTVLVGRAYFEAEAEHSDGLMGLMWQVHSGPTEAATSRARFFGVELPPAFDAWFARGTAKDPDARFHTGAELVAALRGALHGGDHPAAQPLPGPSLVPVDVHATSTGIAGSGIAGSGVVGSGVVGSDAVAGRVVTGTVARAMTRDTVLAGSTGEVPTSRTVSSTDLPRNRSGLLVAGVGAAAVAAVVAFLALRGGSEKPALAVPADAPSASVGTSPPVEGQAGSAATSQVVAPLVASGSASAAASAAPVASAPSTNPTAPIAVPGTRSGPRTAGTSTPASTSQTPKPTATPTSASPEWDGAR